jgi:hypothetical protein
MSHIDQDCTQEFPHRSKVVVNRKKYDEYCMKFKDCSEWTDELKDDNNNPVPFPSKCTPSTFKKMPIIQRGTICEEIKTSFGTIEDVSQNLAVFLQRFQDISSNYVDKYATWMKYPSDSNETEMNKYTDQWQDLKLDVIKERNKLNTLSNNYRIRIKGMSDVLGKDENNHTMATDNLNEEKRKLLSMAGKDMKDNMYNSTSGHIIQTLYYTTAIIVMGIFLRKLN